MNIRGLSRLPTRRRVAIIGAIVAAVLVVLVVLVVLDWATNLGDTPSPRLLTPPAEPIASEAEVFRLEPADLALDPATEQQRVTHPRTLATYRALRPYPGAPPRVPHGLTTEEFREGECNICHDRGGYVERFEAYAPVTPHPEYSNCQQCHLPDARVVGVSLPTSGPDAVCRQCHTPGEETENFAEVDWRTTAWPTTDQRALPDGPPAIPHDLQLRGNCLACHAGLSAVREIRMDHADRANCRQCHLPAAADVGEFRRPAAPELSAGGGE